MRVLELMVYIDGCKYFQTQITWKEQSGTYGLWNKVCLRVAIVLLIGGK